MNVRPVLAVTLGDPAGTVGRSQLEELRTLAFHVEIGMRLEFPEQTPEREHIAKLIEACERLDEYYKDWCEEIDDEYGDERGTAYEQGTNMEFYIESSEWHNISEALRELRKDEK